MGALLYPWLAPRIIRGSLTETRAKHRGMGAFPSRAYTPKIAKIVETEILEPTIKAMNEEGRPFKGVLFRLDSNLRRSKTTGV